MALMASTRPTIRQGSTGEAVRAWQEFLGIDADGVFGPATAAATRNWQAANGLEADGVVGPLTWGKAASKPPILSTANILPSLSLSGIPVWAKVAGGTLGFAALLIGLTPPPPPRTRARQRSRR